MASTMSCRVTVYSSPFGAVDRADSEATLLASTTAVSSFDCDLLPYRNGIHVRCYTSDCSNIETASYLKLEYTALQMPIFAVITETIPIDAETWEFVTEIAAEITVLPHATSISGWTERVHVPKADDTLGAFIEEDPYLGCSQPLDLVQETYFDTASFRASDSYNIVAANMDINLLGADGFTTALEFTNSGSNKSVVVPQEAALEVNYQSPTLIGYNTAGKKQYIAQDIVVNGTQSTEIAESPAVHYFDGKNSQVKNGITKAHALGSSSGIVASYQVPKGFVKNTLSDSYGRLDDGAVQDGYSMCGNIQFHNTGLNFNHSTVQNKRLLVGPMNKYGIASLAGGESIEFNPEDLMFNSSNQIIGTAPDVMCVCDITENGRPSFKYKWVNKIYDSLRGLVNGAQWKNVPIGNMRAEGYSRDMTKFYNDSQIQQADVHTSQTNRFINTMSGMFSGGRSTADNANIGTTMSGGIGGTPSQSIFGGGTSSIGSNASVELLGTAFRLLGNATSSAVENHYGSEKRAQELRQLVYSDSFVAPTVQFPTSATVRDFVGNGVCVYRYKPTQADLTRLDKILNMFGYQHKKELELSDFSNRSRYNYVKASAVHIVAPDFPRYIIEACEESIMMGVRVWHVPYDGNYTIANN